MNAKPDRAVFTVHGGEQVKIEAVFGGAWGLKVAQCLVLCAKLPVLSSIPHAGPRIRRLWVGPTKLADRRLCIWDAQKLKNLVIGAKALNEARLRLNNGVVFRDSPCCGDLKGDQRVQNAC